VSGIVAQLCDDSMMKKRPGGTTHLSISLPTEEAKILERRAKRGYNGNVSRVVSDAIRYIAYEEGRPNGGVDAPAGVKLCSADCSSSPPRMM
jgi:hypothetical protein